MYNVIMQSGLIGEFDAPNTVSLILITLFYGLAAYYFFGKFISWGSDKWGVAPGNAAAVKAVAVLSAILPNIIYLILAYAAAGSEDPSARIRAYNILAWSHWPVLSVIFGVFIVLIGIGKWRFQYIAQAAMIPFVLHMFADFILYTIPIYFLHPLSVYDVQPYGMGIAVIIDNAVFEGFFEILLIVLVIVLMMAESRRGAGDKGVKPDKGNNKQ